MKGLVDKMLSKVLNPKLLQMILNQSDLILAIMLVGIVSLLIIPVPPGIIDILIALNLMISISLLLVAIYIPTALQLSIFPSLLLVTTLFRLGVNISSTRQILLHMNAGDIIFAFGNFVVGGNYVVGGVIFLIITLVQFIVITKGAERVAEVAARFRLDAMPGKQMSIDADMRAGVLDQDQARTKRLDIQKESEMYGSMDGAMKFVKGDAIAGIVITLINVIGGLVIGVAMHGLTLAESAQIYSLLSIGDGLVSQIPALLISITAGVVTTRVSSEDKDTNLGSEISGQILKQPKALMISACVLILMGIGIPGFPVIVFIPMGMGLAGLAYMLMQMKKKKTATASAGGGSSTSGSVSSQTDVDGHSVIQGGGIDDYALTLPIILEMGTHTSTLVSKGGGVDFVEGMIPRMRQALYHDLGVRFPGVHVRTDSPTLEDTEYSIHLNEVPVIRGKALKGYVLTNETEEHLNRFNLPYASYKNSLGLPSLWVEAKYKDLLSKAGIKFWDELEVVILHISYFLRTHSSEFLGIQEVRSMLEFMEKTFPDLVKEVTRLIPLQKLTEIFKRLVQEQVSVKDLRTILEALSEWAQSEKDTVLLTEYVRSSLKRYISFKYSQGQSVLSVYLLDPEIEDMIRGAIKQTSAGSYLALDPDSVQMILQAIRSTLGPTPAGGQPPVLLAAIDVRRFARKLIESEFPDISVISYQEVIPEIRIQPLGRIQLS